MTKKEERKLSAIMFTDMVGYSALAQENEALALEVLEEHRKILRELFPLHSGREVETVGDAFFVEFTSALEAVNCAVNIQKVLWERNKNIPNNKHIKIRIGIHLGDVVHKGVNVLGDGVNIAARVEPIAKPGGICITEDVAHQVHNKIEFSLKKVNLKQLKNIKIPVQVYDIVLPWLEESKDVNWSKTRKNRVLFVFSIILAIVIILLLRWFLQDKSSPDNKSKWQNSIAVLPFATIDRTEESEIFSEGIHEDIISQIAKISNIKVIARTSVLQYKDTQKRLKEIGEDLNVKTVLEGSVRRSGDRIRIVAKLINANTEDLIWTESYNRDYSDIFAIQSDVAIKIAEEFQAVVTDEEEQAINEVPTNNLEAYELYQKGINYRSQGFILEKFKSEIALLEKSIELDPEFVLAYSELCKAHLMIFWYNEQLPKEHLQSAEWALDKAKQIDPNNASVNLAEGYYYYYGLRDYTKALDKFELALQKYPNDSELLAAIGYVKRRLGKYYEALEYQQKAAEIDPQSSNKAHEIGKTARLLRNWDLAEQFLIRATSISPQNIWAYLDWVELSIDKTGDFLEAGKILENALAYNIPEKLIFIRVFMEYMNRNYINALKVLNEYKYKNTADDSKILFYKGRVASAMKEYELAASYFDSLRIIGESGLKENPSNWIYHDYLYKAYAGLGMNEEFNRELELLEALVPFESDVLVGTNRNIQKIECLIWLKEYDEAIVLIEQMLSKPSLLTISRLKLSPVYDPVRNNSRFKSILSKNQ